MRGLDVEGLAGWLAAERPDLAGGALTAVPLAGGRSNLTFRIDGARIPLVLRRPPLGRVPSTAHDMRREHTVVAALHGSAVSVPPAIALVDDTAAGRVTGTPFFLMGLVPGRVLDDRAKNAVFTPAGLHALGIDLAETLARLHALDVARIGLGSFGRPAGYLVRQLSTWRRQYDAARSRALPALDALQEGLVAGVPVAGRTGLVHGDYRLDNLLVTGEGDSPEITAVLDWELAALGDPLVDLGLLGLYWEVDALPPAAATLSRSAVDVPAGYPGFAELVDAYAAASGLRVPDLAWYRAFAAYKLAVIIEQLHHRDVTGGAAGTELAGIGALVEPIAEAGLARIAAGGKDPDGLR